MYVKVPDLVFLVDDSEYSRSSGFPPAEGSEVTIDHPLFGSGAFVVVKPPRYTYTSTQSHMDVAAAQKGDPFAIVPGPVYVHLARVPVR